MVCYCEVDYSCPYFVPHCLFFWLTFRTCSEDSANAEFPPFLTAPLCQACIAHRANPVHQTNACSLGRYDSYVFRQSSIFESLVLCISYCYIFELRFDSLFLLLLFSSFFLLLSFIYLFIYFIFYFIILTL
jgi:hypothetical protein